MAFRPQQTVIVGATGPTGLHLARILVGRGWPVRAVSRSPDHLDEVFGDLDVERAVGDATDPASLRSAVAGCDLVVDCIGLPPERMADHPKTAENLAAAIAETGARCLLVCSYWSYFPHRGPIVNEDHPREGGHDWFRWRREAEDILQGAGAAVAHLPDFFGPDVHVSSVQMALQEALDGKPISALGDADARREIAFIPEVMELVADLSIHEEAYGEHWAVPGNGAASPRDLARIAGEHLGRTVKVRAYAPWMLKLLALVVPALKPVVPLAPHYGRGVRYDTAKLRRLLGDEALELTPVEKAIATTLDWMAGSAAVPPAS